jgi:hypothetical protein
MRRIDTATKAEDLNGVGKDGFTSGNSNSGIPPTQVSAQWFNDSQEEICRVIEDAGVTLGSATDQLSFAIEGRIRYRRPIQFTQSLHSFRSHNTAGDVRDNWRVWEATDYKKGVAGNTTQLLFFFNLPTELQNCQMWVEVWANLVDDVDIDYYSNVHLRASVKRVTGSPVIQKSTEVDIDTDGGNPYDVVWSLVGGGGSLLTLSAELPVAIGSSFNIFAHMKIRAVSRV